MPAEHTGSVQVGGGDDRPEAARKAAAALADVEPRPGVPKPDPILVADGVARRFGGLTAVEVEHLEVQRGVITALIGPNGAGKTTFFNLLTGFDKPNEGSWSFEGKKLGGVPAHRVARRGMVRTFQLTKALSRLTVIDNMRLGATGQKGENFFRALVPGIWRSQQESIDERAHDLLRRFKLDAKADDFAGSLSGGQRKLLEMARALMVEPTMVMLDEPMAGVNPALTQSLLGHVKDLRSQGMTVLFVEHDMDMVRDISDWVVVMAQGKIVAEGPPDVVMADQAVIDAYLGAHHDDDLTPEQEQAEVEAAEAELDDAAAAREEEVVSTPLGKDQHEAVSQESDGRDTSASDDKARADHLAAAGNALVRVDDVYAGYLPGVNILNGCDLHCDKGELVGIIGPNGAGKSTLLKSMFGLVSVREGTITLAGEDITGLKAHQLVAKGVGFVPQTNNVFPRLTIEENLQMGLYHEPKKFGERFEYVAELFPALAKRRKQRAGSLSGGERQMVAMGRALMPSPSVLLLDEPSAGLSPALQDEVFLRCRQINKTGVSIIMVEQNARRCLQICDRGYVLDQGRNAYTASGKDLMNDPKVIELYLGTLAKA